MSDKNALIGALGASLALAVLAGILLAGPASADTVSLPQNQTLEVSNDTESLRAVGENASGELNVTVYEVADSGNVTEVTNGTLNATDANGGTDTYSFTEIDAQNVSQYKISVNGDFAIESLVLEKVKIASGGGGILPAKSGSPMVLAAGVIVLLAIGVVGFSRWD